jgi:hypothetical protein
VRRVEARLAVAVGGLEAEVTRRCDRLVGVSRKPRTSPCFFGLITTYLPSRFHVRPVNIRRQATEHDFRIDWSDSYE